jgi:hypothetical protein
MALVMEQFIVRELKEETEGTRGRPAQMPNC